MKEISSETAASGSCYQLASLLFGNEVGFDGELTSTKAIHVAGCGVDNAGMPDEETFVQRASGVIAVATDNHIFAATDVEIRMGICGGAVLACMRGEEKPLVVGMLEGVVSSVNTGEDGEHNVLKPLQGNAAIVPAGVLAEFCSSLHM